MDHLSDILGRICPVEVSENFRVFVLDLHCTNVLIIARIDDHDEKGNAIFTILELEYGYEDVLLNKRYELYKKYGIVPAGTRG